MITEGFVDGDLVERFLDLSQAQMEEVCKGLKVRLLLDANFCYWLTGHHSKVTVASYRSRGIGGVGGGGIRGGVSKTPFDRLVSNTSYKALPAWPAMLQLQLYIVYHL